VTFPDHHHPATIHAADRADPRGVVTDGLLPSPTSQELRNVDGMRNGSKGEIVYAREIAGRVQVKSGNRVLIAVAAIRAL